MKCLAHLIPIFLGSIITRRKKLFEFVLERGHDATARCNCNECCWTTSSPQSFGLRSSQLCTGGKFWIKDPIDGLVQVWHLLLLLYGGGGGRPRWKDIIWSLLLLIWTMWKDFGTFVTSIPGMILRCQKCNETLKLWHLTVRLKIYPELLYRSVYMMMLHICTSCGGP